MASWLWLVLPVALSAALSVEHRHPEFLLPGGGTLEEHVQRSRDVFLRRIRCGARHGIPEKLCERCISAEKIVNIVKRPDGATNETLLGQWARVSVVFLNHFLTFRTSCTTESIQSGSVGGCLSYEPCWSMLRARYLAPERSPAESLEALESLLREVKAAYEPNPSAQCFSAEMILNEANLNSGNMEGLPREESLVLLLMSHLYSGECIDVGESVADFLDDIFMHYGNGCERVMTESGFAKLWNDLQMQRKGNHIDHEVQKSSCFPDTPAASPHSDKGTTLHPNEVSGSNLTSVVVLVSSNKTENSSRDIYDSDLYLVENENENKERSTSRRQVRHMPSPSDHQHKNLANECLPSHDLLERFLTPGNQVITSSEFLQLCPALVQQAVSGVCSAQLKSVGVNSFKSNKTADVFEQVQSISSNASPWLAVASVSVITLISLLGLFLLPVLKKSFFVHINAFFTGLAFGTMSGDVVLHIMPQYLGLHQHQDDGHHDHAEETTLDRLFPSYLQRQLVFFLTMYLLFLLETIFSALTGHEKEHRGHSHGPVEFTLRDLNPSGDVENRETKAKVSGCLRITQFLRPSNLLSGMSSKAAVIVLADTVHNFADGMAIAVGFSMSYKDGLSTSVAVFFHELPHEIGDFAILMNCGLSYWKAFVFNLLSGLSAFIGLGVGVFTAALFREWLLCITAGLFFFVVMGEMLPDMRLESKEKWKEFAVKITGTVLGIMTMICIAMYELSAS